MTELTNVIIDDDGRIHVPVPVMRRFGLQVGSVLVVAADEGEAVAEAEVSPGRGLIESDGLLVFDAQPLADLTSAIEVARENRAASLLGFLPQ